VTNDEAKKVLTELRAYVDVKLRHDGESSQALAIALWLFDWHQAVKAGDDMKTWEGEHPRPGS